MIFDIDYEYSMIFDIDYEYSMIIDYGYNSKETVRVASRLNILVVFYTFPRIHSIDHASANSALKNFKSTETQRK